MEARTFLEMLEAQWLEEKFVCVGIDPSFDEFPESYIRRCELARTAAWREVFNFNRAIVDATHDIAAAYKLNPAHYLASDRGGHGISALHLTCDYINKIAPHVPVILDCKAIDIAKSSAKYANYAFDILGVNAVTVVPYFGREALLPFLERKDKGVFVLVSSSNRGAEEIQNLQVYVGEEIIERPMRFEHIAVHRPLYLVIARHIAEFWNINGNCMVVAGATRLEELWRVREVVGNMTILAPGVGTQGGDLEKAVAGVVSRRGRDFLIASSSAITYASRGKDFADAARRETLALHEQIRCYLKQKIARGV